MLGNPSPIPGWAVESTAVVGNTQPDHFTGVVVMCRDGHPPRLRMFDNIGKCLLDDSQIRMT
jgi:hypothetical protein